MHADQGQAYAMIMAGYESTANALAFTLYLLTLNRDKEAKVIAEVVAYGTTTPGYADLARYACSAHVRVCTCACKLFLYSEGAATIDF